MIHPAHEELAAWLEDRLDGQRARRVAAHVASCESCRIVADTLRSAVPSGAPASARRRLLGRGGRRWWVAAAAVWLLSALTGLLVPMDRTEPPSSSPPRTYVHLDFGTEPALFLVTKGEIVRLRRGDREISMLGAERMPNETLVAAVRLPEPIRVNRDSTIRVRFSTNSGPFIAWLIPLNRDAQIVRIEPERSAEGEVLTATARLEESRGEEIDTICLVAPAGAGRASRPFLYLENIEIKSTE